MSFRAVGGVSHENLDEMTDRSSLLGAILSLSALWDSADKVVQGFDANADRHFITADYPHGNR